MTEPALGVVGIGEHGDRGHGKDLGDPVLNVEDGRGRKPAALREDDVCCFLHAFPSSDPGSSILVSNRKRPDFTPWCAPASRTVVHTSRHSQTVSASGGSLVGPVALRAVGLLRMRSMSSSV